MQAVPIVPLQKPIPSLNTAECRKGRGRRTCRRASEIDASPKGTVQDAMNGERDKMRVQIEENAEYLLVFTFCTP